MKYRFEFPALIPVMVSGTVEAETEDEAAEKVAEGRFDEWETQEQDAKPESMSMHSINIEPATSECGTQR